MRRIAQTGKALLVALKNGDSFAVVVGSRIALHPALDAWMRGDRYAEVTRLTGRDDLAIIHATTDHGLRLRLRPDDITEVVK